MNYVTGKSEEDCGVDESTWGFSGFCGDAGWRLKNKPKSKGEYTTMKNIFLMNGPT